MKLWFGQKSTESETTVAEQAEEKEKIVTEAPNPVSAPPHVVRIASVQKPESASEPDSVPALPSAPSVAPSVPPAAPSAPLAVPAAPSPSPLPVAAPPPNPAAPNPRAQFQELINGFYDVIFIMDGSGRVICSNTRAEPVLGYTEDDLWDMEISKIVKGITPVIFRQMMDALHNSQQVLISTRCVRKDGTEFLAEVSASFVHLTREENLVFLIRNIERREAAIRERVMKELSSQSAECAAAPLPQAKARVVLKKAPSPTAGA